MKIITVTATELKNNLGKFLELVTDPLNQTEVVITKNGKPIAKLESSFTNPAAALSGLLAENTEGDILHANEIKQK